MIDIDEIRQLQQAGKLTEAEKTCRALLEKDPGLEAGQVLLALILTQLQQSEEAKKLVDGEISTEITAVASDLGLLCILRGEPDRASELLESACEQPDCDYVAFARLGALKTMQGKLEEAEVALREALERSPDHAAILSNLGGVFLRQDKIEEALAAYESALRLAPDLEPAMQGKSAVYLLQDRATELLLEVEENLEQQPDNLKLKLKKLHILVLEERFEEARDVLRDLISEYPKDIGYPLQLLNLYMREEQYLMALKELKSIEPEFPDEISLLNIKARALKEIGQLDRAMEIIGNAMDIDPDSIPSLLVRASIYADKEEYISAEKDLKKILETHQGMAEAWSLLGHIYLWRGKLDEAIEALERAALINPAAFSGLVEARSIPEDPAVIECMDRFASYRLVPSEAKSSMNFALIKVSEKLGDYKKAFEYATKANEIQHARINHNSKKHSQFTKKIIDAFTPDLFEKFEGLGNYSERPVFVVGMPRSGTTLTEQIIASHTQAFGAGELGVISAITRLLPRVLNIRMPYPDCLKKITQRTIDHGAQYYLNALKKRDSSAKRVVDKLPHNFMHLGLISILFPYAKIIHVKRDLRDIAISNYFTNFKMKRAGMSYAFDLKDIGHMLNDYQNIMAHWRNVLPTPIYEFNYEDLVADPETHEKKLIEFVGLEWSPEVLEFYQSDRTIRTASVWQVRQPIYESSKERWRHYEEYLDPLLEVLKL